MTAAQLAETLDPQHEIAGWWYFECYRNQADGRFKFRTTYENPKLPNDGTFTVYTTYVGPSDSAALLDTVEEITKGSKE